MANENKKDFNAMLGDSKDMPKIQIVTDEKSIKKYGGDRMYFAPPADYDRVMRWVPFGKLLTVGMIREYFAKENGADFTEPITAGIFNFMGQYGTKWSYLTAFAVVTIIPVALIFIFMQKYIVSGMTSGAVKG